MNSKVCDFGLSLPGIPEFLAWPDFMNYALDNFRQLHYFNFRLVVNTMETNEQDASSVC